MLTNGLVEIDEKKYADSVWEIVTRANRDMIEKMREDETMCKAMAEIFKPEIDAAFHDGFSDGFNNGFSDGLNNGRIQVFKNMINCGISMQEAQNLAEISDELVQRALAARESDTI